MKLGILVEVEEGLGWEQWRTTYTAAERLGFDSVWLSDHLQSPWPHRPHGLETWMALAVAAAETQRVELGPLVSPITFREPAIVARMAESLYGLARGRFVLGLGIGWNADEHAATGIAFPPAAERAQRLADAIRRIRCDLGDYYLPVLIGGGGARLSLPLVARFADEWNVTTGSVDAYQKMSGQLDGLCRDIGRDPRDIRRSVATGVLIGRDPDDLHARAERMRRCIPPLADARDVLESARQMGWLVGTPQTVRDRLSELQVAGVDRVMVGHYDVANVGTLELLAETVLPSLG
jgi:alkanesulfonate monooxygenase SsuD/methylene tetrahydromethanopterin reductase-like flavin-dependent oxidoreductase (luciferase family)